MVENIITYFFAVLPRLELLVLGALALVSDFVLGAEGFAFGLMFFRALPVLAFFVDALFAVEDFFVRAAFDVMAFLAVTPGAFLAGALSLGLDAWVEAAFLVVDLTAVVALAGTLALVRAVVVVAFLSVGLATGLVSFLARLTGLFSFVWLASSAFPLGANFTLPEGPLGRVKTPFSSPLMMARLIFELTRPVISK